MSRWLRNDCALGVARAVAEHLARHPYTRDEHAALVCWVHDLVLAAVTEFEEKAARERHRLAHTLYPRRSP